MTSTGVIDSNSNDKKIIKGLILNNALFVQSLRVFANSSTLSGLGTTEGEINNSPQDPSGNFLSRLGDRMLGPLALSPPLDFTIEIDALNTIDIGPLNENFQYTSNVQLDSIQPNSFILDIIAGAAFDGQLLFLRTFAPTTPFTISQGTLANGGNIQTGDGNDLVVGDLQIVALIFDEALKIEANTGGSWRVYSISSGGGSGEEFFGPWTANHDAGNKQLLNLALLQITDSLGGDHGALIGLGPTVNAVRLILTAGEKFQIFDNVTNILEIDDTTGLTMIGSHVINMGNNVINTISELRFSNNNPHTPSNELTIAFDENDDALKYSVALTTDSHRFYADTDLLASFSRVGSNQGQLSIQAVVAVSLQAIETLLLSTFDNTSPTNGEIWRNLSGVFQFRENGVTVGLGGGGASNEISEGDSFVRVTDPGAAATINFEVDATPLGSVTTALGWVLENNMILASGDLTLASGDIILGNGFEIRNTSSNTTTFAIPAGEFLSITESGAVRVLIEEDILFSCASNDDILFQEIGVPVGKYDGGINEWQFEEPVRFNGDISGDIVGTASNFLGSLAVPWAGLDAGRVNLVSGGVIAGRLLVDSNGVEIEALLSGDFIELKTQGSTRANFKAEADGGITFFEPLEVNDNIRIDGGNMIHAHDGIECGFAVTDDITSPGSFGTMQMPLVTGNLISAATADSDFGAAIGCYGIYLNGQGAGTPTFIIKIDDSPSTWAIMVLSASGNVSGGRLT